MEQNRETNTTVLIADDSSLIRTNLGTLIKDTRGDVELEYSFDLESTCRMLHSVSVDILILDIRFPDGSGYDVLRLISRWENRPFVMILTNYVSTQTRRKSLDLGADLFLDKTEEYERAVEEVLRLEHR